ncbi:GNAT family N-acetyltransferase [Clostridium scatologenes]|uniref:GNAT family acetyltransferase n=1 Tax=Clostridium scatologenes TaxID=1548 RepID=A0A0E3JRB5_CLOSL|nr:GNAT family N-acetyltransferase [Clostridium scatologenes]AKA71585.1 GNAT family acetyltransferase [Clostridium scatologenes]
MTQISIEKYKDIYFKDVVSLLVSSFESKFFHRQNLTSNNIEDILDHIWNIKQEDLGYLHFVAKNDKKIVGVILIRVGNSLKSDNKIPLFSLCCRYGFFNILFFLFKLYFLTISMSKDCYIEHIAVDKSMRGKGVGKLLISYAEEALRNMKFRSLFLVVAESNPAKHLYYREGFKDVEHINSPFKGYFIGISKWIFMKKDIISNKYRKIL